MSTETLHHHLITARRVDGTPVFNAAGEKIGHVDDLSIDKVTGQVRYALISFGGFLGIGEKFHPLPWSVLDYDTQKSGYVVPLDKAALETAPAYTRDELDQFGGEDRAYRDQLFGYYGIYGAAPYF